MCKTIILQSYQKRNRLQNKSRPIFISFYFIFQILYPSRLRSANNFRLASVRDTVFFYDNILQKIKSLNNEDTLK